MAEDETLMQNQIGFPGRNYHQVYAFVASLQAWRRIEILVRTRKRFRFFDLHHDLATLEAAVTGLVAQHLGAARFAHITLTQHVSHLMHSLKSGPYGPV
jgi:hypothetical protein